MRIILKSLLPIYQLLKPALFCTLCLALEACQQGVVYQQVHTLPGSIFYRDSSIHFSFPIADSIQAYDIYMLVAYTPTYPYQNLYINYTLQDKNTCPLATALHQSVLFDPKTGKPLGKGWGENKYIELLLLKNYNFAQPNAYSLILTQFMRQEALPGIHQVGIKICKTPLAQP
jgi:gliding motility-associated lipoprotein GldH